MHFFYSATTFAYYIILINRASIIQQEITKVGKVNEESLYKPVLIRGVDRKSYTHFKSDYANLAA